MFLIINKLTDMQILCWFIRKITINNLILFLNCFLIMISINYLKQIRKLFIYRNGLIFRKWLGKLIWNFISFLIKSKNRISIENIYYKFSLKQSFFEIIETRMIRLILLIAFACLTVKNQFVFGQFSKSII